MVRATLSGEMDVDMMANTLMIRKKGTDNLLGKTGGHIKANGKTVSRMGEEYL